MERGGWGERLNKTVEIGDKAVRITVEKNGEKIQTISISIDSDSVVLELPSEWINKIVTKIKRGLFETFSKIDKWMRGESKEERDFEEQYKEAFGYLSNFLVKYVGNKKEINEFLSQFSKKQIIEFFHCLKNSILLDKDRNDRPPLVVYGPGGNNEPPQPEDLYKQFGGIFWVLDQKVMWRDVIRVDWDRVASMSDEDLGREIAEIIGKLKNNGKDLSKLALCSNWSKDMEIVRRVVNLIVSEIRNLEGPDVQIPLTPSC